MKIIFILPVFVILVSFGIQESFGDESDQLEWKKEQIIGKYHNDESKRDDIFLIQYKSTTGNVSFSTLGSDDFFVGFMVEYTTPYLSSQADNLEIKIPRNYPYTNAAAALGEIIVLVNGQEYNDVLSMTDCFLHFSIPISGNSKIELAPTNYLTSIPFIGETIPNHCIVKTILLSPKQQTANDIPLNEVICKEGLELIFKYDSSPACVKPTTAIKLIERDWAITNSIGKHGNDSEKTWVEIEATQCADPWYNDMISFYQENEEYKEGPIQIIKNFYEKLGVTIYDIKKEDRFQGNVFCEACNCSDGFTWLFLIPTSEVPKMLDMGFIISSGP